jgi:8-oxo-dGTP pyrophosphatase MutT (NUDIX family)
VVVVPGSRGADVAFIKRSERAGDPWSGHMALPGGRRDELDDDLAATARRETREEIGVELDGPGVRLPDQSGRTSRGLIAAFVHVLDHRPPLHPDPREVAEALWIPLRRLADPSAGVRLRWTGIVLPAIDHDGRIIWGLTHRIIGTFLQAIDLPQPD